MTSSAGNALLRAGFFTTSTLSVATAAPFYL